MKVIFLKFLPNVWHIWEIKEVNDSYARNFLIPQKIARKITPKEEEEINKKRKKEEQKKIELIENRHKIQELLQWQVIEFNVKADKDKKMYGSIWEKEVISYIKNKFNIELTKKNIDFWPDWHIKKLWTRDIFIKLWHDSIAKITIKVTE